MEIENNTPSGIAAKEYAKIVPKKRPKAFYHKFTGDVPIILVKRSDDLYKVLDKKMKEDTEFKEGWAQTHAVLMEFPKSGIKAIVVDIEMIRQVGGDKWKDHLEYIIAHESCHLQHGDEKKTDACACKKLRSHNKEAYNLAVATYRMRYKEEPDTSYDTVKEYRILSGELV